MSVHNKIRGLGMRLFSPVLGTQAHVDHVIVLQDERSLMKTKLCVGRSYVFS